MRRITWVVWSVWVLVGLGGCGSDLDKVGDATFIGAAGGRITVEGFTTIWPAGALQETVIVRTRRWAEQISLPTGITAQVSSVYRVQLEPVDQMGTAPTSVTRPITLSLPIPADLSGEQQARLVWLSSTDGSAYQILGGTLRAGNVEASTTRLGWWTLGLRAATGGSP